MSEDQIHYSELIDTAMRGVVREVLRKVEKNGLPGQHHFYITFYTNHPNAQVSEALRARYPREMTIVMQHQFWDFLVEEKQFSVTLSFGGVPEKLVIPYASLAAFADPSIKFGLQFQTKWDAAALPASPLTYDNETKTEATEEAAEAGSAEIISLDAFRKK
jgi:uncharacterized protein